MSATWGFLFCARIFDVRIESRGALFGFWLPLTIFYALCALYAASMGGTTAAMRLDEYSHFTQIQRFLAGDFRILEFMTVTPGYHTVMAALMRILGANSFVAARLINSGFGLLAVAAFHCLRRDAVGRNDFPATAQFAVLPIFLLLAFMVQTDALSLALTLWSVWAAGRQRHWLAAILLLCAMCVRQNNVLWSVLIAWPVLRMAWRRDTPLQSASAIAWRLVPYAFVVSAFVVYWIANGSVSISQSSAKVHPDFSLHSGNLFYLMFVGSLLFVFPCLESWRRFVVDLRSRPWLVALPLGLAVLYVGTFEVDHPFNLLQPPDLRDALLIRVRESASWYYAFGAVAVFGGVGLLWQKLQTKDAAIFWAVTVLFVSLSWLIEQRYYLIPFALFMAWRVPQSANVERATLALWAPLAVLFFWGMMTGNLYI